MEDTPLLLRITGSPALHEAGTANVMASVQLPEVMDGIMRYPLSNWLLLSIGKESGNAGRWYSTHSHSEDSGWYPYWKGTTERFTLRDWNKTVGMGVVTDILE